MVGRESERGQGLLAWTAVLLFFVVVPLIALVGDGARIYFVRNRLQTALDAACQDGAWSAADRAHFRETGAATFLPESQVVAIARSTFYTILVELDASGYSAEIAVQPNYADLIVSCQGQAQVPLMILDRSVAVEAVTASSIRFR
jgi:hypothetical protein